MKIKRRELQSIIDEYLLNEVDSRIFKGSGRDKWEYQLKGGVWHTRKQGRRSWKSLAKNKAATDALNQRYPEAMGISIDPSGPDFEEKPAPSWWDPSSWFGDEEAAPVPGEEQAQEKSPPIVFYDRLPDIEIDKFLPTLQKGRDAKVSKTDAKGCAEWVNAQTGYSHGNAWHQHAEATWSAFDDAVKDQGLLKKLSDIFTYINRNPERNQRRKIRTLQAIVKNLVPDQSQFNKLELGDRVGLFYYKSTNHAIAFYEAATGTRNLGKSGAPGSTGEGPFFQDQNGRAWSPEMIGDRNLKFSPSPALLTGGFGMNTHIGIVGAKLASGEPVIFHNVHPVIHATPLRALSSKTSAIVWYSKGERVGQKVKRAVNTGASFIRSAGDTISKYAKQFGLAENTSLLDYYHFDDD